MKPKGKSSMSSEQKVADIDIVVDHFLAICEKAGIPLLLAVGTGRGTADLRAHGSMEQVASLKCFLDIYIHRCVSEELDKHLAPPSPQGNLN